MQSDHNFLAVLPECLKPYYTTPTVNAPIKLSEGQVTLCSDGQKIEEAPGAVSLVWLPWPRLELLVGAARWEAILDKKKWTASIPGRSNAMPIVCTSSSMSGGENAKPPESRWLFDTNDKLPACRLRTIQFHIANGPTYLGTPIRNETGTGGHAGRAAMEAGPWQIRLDSIEEWHCGENPKALKANRGYAITHVGLLERVDGCSFATEDAEAVLKAIGSMLSFCCGAWTNPLLLIAEEEGTKIQYHIWRDGGIDRFGSRSSWFDQHSSDGFKAFAGLYSRLADELWNEPIRHALHWFIVANKPGPVSIEGAIVLQQAAFELLAWTLLVQDRNVLSEDGIQKLPASDRIRLTLSTCGVPLGVPAELGELLRAAKAENWQDGPHATTEIRNAIVHASPQKRARILACGPDVFTEAWMLGQWYLELILLGLFDYHGRYSNRLRLPCWQGTEVEPVPWAKT